MDLALSPFQQDPATSASGSGSGSATPTQGTPVACAGTAIGSAAAEHEGSDPQGDDPREQKLRFPDDAYTPQWVRGQGPHKEGLCSLCPSPGRWLQLKNSAFWYHKQFTHGISSISCVPFTLPRQTRI
ncbi:hypothetical protein BC831DRAFT_395616, partial [Entophlyctis helioformis]